MTANCRLLRLSQLLDACSRGDSDGRPLVGISFDDGYLDNYDHALPLLLRAGAPATFFLTLGYLDRDPEVMRGFQSRRRASAAEMEPMTWDQVGELAARGFEVGSHTYGHPNLRRLEGSRLEFEIRGSKTLLEERIGRPVDGFAYPFGRPGSHFDAGTAARVRAAGYRYGFSVAYRGLLPGDSLYAIPRFSISADSISTLADKVNGAWDLVGRIHENAPPWVRFLASPRGFCRTRS